MFDFYISMLQSKYIIIPSENEKNLMNELKIFLCYSRRDKPVCQKLVDVLQNYNVWYDYRIQGGEKWWQIILRQLNWCDTLIYLISQAAIESEYCQKEVQIAMELGKIIVPVLVRDDGEIPSNLSDIQYVDLRNGIDDIPNIVSLLNSLQNHERRLRKNPKTSLIMEELNTSAFSQPNVDKNSLENSNLLIPFNVTDAIRRQKYGTIREETISQYLNYIQRFLQYVSGIEHKGFKEQELSLSQVPLETLKQAMKVPLVRSWFDQLRASGLKQLQHAKTSLVILSENLLDYNYIDELDYHRIKALDISVAYSSISLAITEQQLRTVIQYITTDKNLRSEASKRDALILALATAIELHQIANA